MTFADFVDTPEGMAWLLSDDFERRCCELFRRLDAGELFTMADAAELVDMPVAAFIEAFALYLTAEHAQARLMAESVRATKH